MLQPGQDHSKAKQRGHREEKEHLAPLWPPPGLSNHHPRLQEDTTEFASRHGRQAAGCQHPGSGKVFENQRLHLQGPGGPALNTEDERADLQATRGLGTHAAQT